MKVTSMDRHKRDQADAIMKDIKIESDVTTRVNLELQVNKYSIHDK
jgi:hypothetical protein